MQRLAEHGARTSGDPCAELGDRHDHVAVSISPTSERHERERERTRERERERTRGVPCDSESDSAGGALPLIDLLREDV